MTGRAAREEWWIGFWGSHLIGINMQNAVVGPASSWLAKESTEPLHMLALMLLIQALTVAAILSVQIRVSTRRSRDRDVRLITLWPYAALYILTSFWPFLRPLSPIDFPGFWLPVILLAAWLTFQLGIKSGDPGPNRWGRAPSRRLPFIGPDNYRPPRS